ncbi:MAG TPA: metallophosphoesterase family protein [Gemmatimonadaceae bacterium]|nr:metallophosphoesterase family protein [Gemmatimonadaceae bacterium]
MRIGLISDTHLPSLVRDLDELGPGIRAFLSTVDVILHGGDVTAPSVLDWCAQFSDVLVAKGNNDTFADARVAPLQRLDVDGWRIAMVHELRPETRPMPELLRRATGGDHVDILIAGDTHVERLEQRDGVILVNSGSPILPHHKSTRLGTLGLLEIMNGHLRAEVFRVGETPGLANPAKDLVLEVERDWEAAKDPGSSKD